MVCEMFSCAFSDSCENLHCPAFEQRAECDRYSCDYCIFRDGCHRLEEEDEEGD